MNKNQPITKRQREEIRKTLSSTPATRLPFPFAHGDPAFLRCIEEAIATPELIQNFCRLTGSRIDKFSSRSGIERMIDEATGHQDDQMREFVKFVHDSIYLRLPDEAINAFRLAAEMEEAT